MCAPKTQPKETEAERDEDYHTAIHEINHILGFSRYQMGLWRDENNQVRVCHFLTVNLIMYE